MSARVQRPGVGRALSSLLALVVLVGLPAVAPAPVAGASLKDQISAARERQNDLARSIARQETLIAGLRRDQASTEAALRDTVAPAFPSSPGVARAQASTTASTSPTPPAPPSARRRTA